MHPFRDGKPVGEIYVGATYIEDGENRDVVFEGTKMIGRAFAAPK